MSYYIEKKVALDYENAIERTKEVLKEQGFGIITEIDMKSVLKTKIDKDIEPYIILGACNPSYAYHALQTEDNIGLMLPCNVLVRHIKQGGVVVSAIDPLEAMKPVGNDALIDMAKEVREKLEKAIHDL